MAIRCRQCGENNNSGNLLCLACGYFLESPEALTEGPMLRERPTLPPVRRPSRVGPTAEAANPVTYTFQSEVRASHVGRYLVLILFILTLAVVGWQRRDLRTLASRFSNGPPSSRSKVTNAPPAPVPVSPATVLTPQNADPEPSALVSKHSQSAAGKTSSQVPSQEGSVAA